MVLNDTYKMFLQGMLERRFVVQDDALALLNIVTNRDSNTKTDLDKVIKHINDDIKKFYLSIKQQVCDLTSQNFVVLVATLPAPSKDENFNKAVYAYSNAERDYFKNIMEDIITSEERCIRRNTALNLTVAGGSSQSQNWGPHQYDQVLTKFEQDGWLATVDGVGKVFLGARAIAELEHMLVKDYQVESCKLCSHVCLVGFICDVCSLMTHVHCQNKFSQRKGARGNKCWKCDSDMRRT